VAGAGSQLIDSLGTIILLVVVILVVVLAIRVFGGPSGMDIFRRARRVFGQDRAPAPLREPTLQDLRPGDAISFWDGQDVVVDNVVQCREEITGRASTWSWVLLSSGQVLEVAPDGNVLYAASEVLLQGSEPFTASPPSPSTAARSSCSRHASATNRLRGSRCS
jgi:hypothetical protein